MMGCNYGEAGPYRQRQARDYCGWQQAEDEFKAEAATIKHSEGYFWSARKEISR